MRSLLAPRTLVLELMYFSFLYLFLSVIHVGGLTWAVADIEEFKQESMMLASLRHPNIVDFYGVAFDPATSYLYLGIATYFLFSVISAQFFIEKKLPFGLCLLSNNKLVTELARSSLQACIFENPSVPLDHRLLHSIGLQV